MYNQGLQKTFCAINLLLSAYTAVGITIHVYEHHIKFQAQIIRMLYLCTIRFKIGDSRPRYLQPTVLHCRSMTGHLKFFAGYTLPFGKSPDSS